MSQGKSSSKPFKSIKEVLHENCVDGEPQHFYVFDPKDSDVCEMCKQEVVKDQYVVKMHESGIEPAHERCLVVKTTIGKFSRQYSEREPLHVGVSNSTASLVFNFDESGVHVDEVDRWEECINIPLPCFVSNPQWDEDLFTTSELWGGEVYNGLDNNCYDFAISFLNRIKFNQSTQNEKMSFVDEFMAGPFSTFSAFHKVHQQLAEAQENADKDDVILLKINHKEFGEMEDKSVISSHCCDGCGTMIESELDLHTCAVCDDFDLCEQCFRGGFTNDMHTLYHTFKE